MTSKQEIKDLLSNEIKNCPEYQEVLLLKQYIIDKINEPNIVSMYLSYNFSNQLINDDSKNLFKLCFKNEFGWIENNMNKDCIILDLSKFLE